MMLFRLIEKYLEPQGRIYLKVFHLMMNKMIITIFNLIDIQKLLIISMK